MAAEYYVGPWRHNKNVLLRQPIKKMDSYDNQSHATKLPRGQTILLWHTREIVR